MDGLKVGDRVVVTNGSAKGRTGKIEDVAKVRWSPTVPTFAVRFPPPMGLCAIRADYLERAA